LFVVSRGKVLKSYELGFALKINIKIYLGQYFSEIVEIKRDV